MLHFVTICADLEEKPRDIQNLNIWFKLHSHFLFITNLFLVSNPKNIYYIGSEIAPFVDQRNSQDFRYKKELYTLCDFLTLTDRISRERIRKALFDIYKIVVSGDVNNSDSGHDLVIPISTQLGKTVLANRQNYKTHILHRALHIDPFYIKPEWKECVEHGISLLALLNPSFQELLPYQGTYQFPETI